MKKYLSLTYLFVFVISFNATSQVILFPTLLDIQSKNLLRKAKYNRSPNQGLWRSAMEIKLFNKINEKYTSEELRIRRKNPISYHFWQGLKKLENCNDILDTAEVLYQFSIIYYLDSIGYYYPHDETIFRFANKNCNTDPLIYVQDFVLNTRERLDSIVTAIDSKILVYKELEEKTQKELENLEKERDSLENMMQEDEQRIRAIITKRVEKKAKKVNKNLDKIAKGKITQVGFRNQEVKVIKKGNKTVTINLGNGVHAPKIKIQGFDLGKEQDPINKYVANIISEIINTVRIKDKNEVFIYFTIYGLADGYGYETIVGCYREKDTIKEIYKYMNISGNNISFLDFNTLFETYKTVPDSVNIMYNDKILNKILAFLRAYYFYQTAEDELDKEGIPIENIHVNDYYSAEFEKKGQNYRGVKVNLEIKNLFKHYKDKIDSLDMIENNLDSLLDIYNKKIAALEEKKAGYENILYQSQRKKETIVGRAMKNIHDFAGTCNKPRPYNRQIYAILFIDSTGIGEPAMKTAKLMEEFFDDVDNNISHKVKKIVCKGKDCNKQNLLTVIDTLKCGRDNTIFFYYFGQGGGKRANQYPVLFTTDNGEGIDTEWVYKALIKKGARLNLVVADCPNNSKGGFDRYLCDKISTEKCNKEKRRKNYMSYFIKASGNAIISPTNKNIAYNEDGSIYAQCMLNTLYSKKFTKLSNIHRNIRNKYKKVGKKNYYTFDYKSTGLFGESDLLNNGDEKGLNKILWFNRITKYVNLKEKQN